MKGELTVQITGYRKEEAALTNDVVAVIVFSGARTSVRALG